MATEGVKGLIIYQLTRPIVRPWCMFDDSYDRMAERISAGGGWMNGSLASSGYFMPKTVQHLLVRPFWCVGKKLFV